MAWSDPKTWTADDLLTASDLNQYVSDNLSALYALVQGGGRKNLLHNGSMAIRQRTSSSIASITDTADNDELQFGLSVSGWPEGYFTVDRWHTYVETLGTWTQSHETDGPAGSGFTKSLKMLCTTASASPSAGGFVIIDQKIEGQDLQAVKKGTASAEPLTLTFWTKSNKTGTYVARLYDTGNTRHVSATYTIEASATWESQSITFPADTTGTIDNDYTDGLSVQFFLASGSDRTSGTLAETWASVTAANAAPGQTNLAASTNNYWMVTGVQLEIGSASTGFEYKSYATEERECQRYYWQETSPYKFYGSVTHSTATARFWLIPNPVTMRDDPQVFASAGSGHYIGTPDVGSRDKFIAIYDSSGISATSEYDLDYVFVSAEI